MVKHELCAVDFDRLERGSPPPRQLSNGFCRTDCNDWGRFLTWQTFKMPILIQIEVRVLSFYNHRDARSYDGVSFLWGDNDRNYNINLLKRDQQGTGSRWQEELSKGNYKGRSGYQNVQPWELGAWRNFDVLLRNTEPVTDARTQPTNSALLMHSDGMIWDGHTMAPVQTSGRIVVRADRCRAEWRVSVTQGETHMAERIAGGIGEGRYGTNAASSRRGFPGGSRVAYITRGDNWPDALSTSNVNIDGPMLFVTTQGVPDVIKQELARLKVTKIIAVGGTSVVPDSVVHEAEIAAGIRKG